MIGSNNDLSSTTASTISSVSLYTDVKVDSHRWAKATCDSDLNDVLGSSDRLGCPNAERMLSSSEETRPLMTAAFLYTRASTISALSDGKSRRSRSSSLNKGSRAEGRKKLVTLNVSKHHQYTMTKRNCEDDRVDVLSYDDRWEEYSRKRRLPQEGSFVDVDQWVTGFVSVLQNHAPDVTVELEYSTHLGVYDVYILVEGGNVTSESREPRGMGSGLSANVYFIDHPSILSQDAAQIMMALGDLLIRCPYAKIYGLRIGESETFHTSETSETSETMSE